jgi:hypothetical protein
MSKTKKIAVENINSLIEKCFNINSLIEKCFRFVFDLRTSGLQEKPPACLEIIQLLKR